MEIEQSLIKGFIYLALAVLLISAIYIFFGWILQFALALFGIHVTLVQASLIILLINYLLRNRE